MYKIYFDKLLFPVAPAKIDTKIKNLNKTMKLVNGSEINFLKDPGLTEFKMDLLLPNQRYPFSEYKGDFKKAEFFIKELEELKNDNDGFQLIIIRKFGIIDIFNTNIKVSLEDFEIKEDIKNGSDVIAKVKLKKYVDFSTKKIKITPKVAKKKKIPKGKPKREVKNSPAPKKQAKTYTVRRGDCLWNIAKKYYGNGGSYPKIFNANRDKISNPNLIYPGQILIIPV